MNVLYTGNGKVSLVASPNRCYTDLAARFTRSEKDLESILAEEKDIKLIQKIVDNGHLAATEFDFYIFAVEGYSRVCEVQLVRKRLASYMIKSGRVQKNGKRSFDVVVPELLNNIKLTYDNGLTYSYFDILKIIEDWYDIGVKSNIAEEDLRYMKPQATEFKGLIAMDAHALLDWFKIRCCLNAQSEIRDMANKMLKLCKQDNPILFSKAGASCVSLGYCPENKFQNKKCNGNKPTHKDVIKMLDSWR